LRCAEGLLLYRGACQAGSRLPHADTLLRFGY
jgi:hypothetical protein